MHFINAAGHAAYLVGGTVRDILLGRAPKDYDLLTTADLQQVTHSGDAHNAGGGGEYLHCTRGRGQDGLCWRKL